MNNRFMVFLLREPATKKRRGRRFFLFFFVSFVSSWSILIALLLAAGTGSLRLRLSQILFVERVIEIADHHLFPGLRPPANFFRRVGVEIVVERDVVIC